MSDSWLWTQWSRIAGESAVSREVWTDLVARWSEPQRTYHDLSHLMFMLRFMDDYGPVDDATAYAAWLHDAVYDPTSQTNEADSAALAEPILTALDRGELTDRVRELVLLTATHEAPDDDPQAALLLDADLAILGQDPQIYLRYVEAVRREYAHVSDEDFLRGRSEILRGFANRERIYLLDVVHGVLDEPARRNIAAELAVYDARD